MPDRTHAIPEIESQQREQLLPLYRVLIHNDPMTPMEYVVTVLQQVFSKSMVESARIMLEAHHGEVALVEIVPLERAEFHVERAHSLARARKFPLSFTFEPES